MTASSYIRGHKTIYRDGKWHYADNGEIADYERPCPRCNRMPTKEGHDACLDHIPGVESACCGHGVHEPLLF